MPDVTLRHGDRPINADYTPTTGNVAAGQVVLLGNLAGITCGVAVDLILNNAKGAVSIGGGVYEAINLNNAANYAAVFWDDTNNKVTTVSTNNARFGSIASRGGGGANSVCDVLHNPYV